MFFISSAYASPACPVCTIAIGASLEIARHLGVDDGVVGVWAGALLALIGYWTIIWFDKKNWNFKFRNTTLITLSVAMIGFMYISEMTYNPSILGFIDPFLLSSIMGAVVLILSGKWYEYMKAKNNGHAHFPFEKVVIPVVTVWLASMYYHFYPIANNAADLMNF
ncbi:MAG: hypothetical protein R3Y43_00950 [Alphaproteobacteria bacterium]